MARGRSSRRFLKPGLPGTFADGGRASAEDVGREEVVVGRRVPRAPVYAGGDLSVGHVDKIQPPRLLRDRLYDKMCDWDFHDVGEFDDWMPQREWVRAMADLVHYGFAFDREGRRFRLRKSLPGESAQSIVDLLSGATLPNRFEVPLDASPDAVTAEVEVAGEAQSFFPEEDEETEVPLAERMVLDEDGRYVLSVLDYVTDTAGILARKGRGKTYLANVIAEEFLASEFAIPFVVVDPTGCWYGLLSEADGSPSDHRIVLVGGERGHYPLRAALGRQLARTVVAARPTPVVLDLSLLVPEDQHLLVADFAEELYHCNREALHVFVDEVDLFAPQRLNKASKHQGRCLVALDNLTRRGRLRGIGDTLISQRPAIVNKNLLSQVGTMFFLQMMAPQDLEAVESWLHDNIRGEAKHACRADLPILGRGVAYFLRGGDASIFRKFKVKTKATFDSSSTPKVGGVPVVVPRLAALHDEDRVVFDEHYDKHVRALDAEAVVAATSEECKGVRQEVDGGEVSVVEVGGLGPVPEVIDSAVLGLEDDDGEEDVEDEGDAQ
jgi:hypothetical protein